MSDIDLDIGDDIYKEIASFEDYELTQCIVYEMAIRNKKNLQDISDVIEYFKKNKNDIINERGFCINPYIYKTSPPHKNENIHMLKKESETAFCEIVSMIKKLELIKIDWDILLLEYYDKRIDRRFYKILEILRPIYKNNEKIKIIYDELRHILFDYALNIEWHKSHDLIYSIFFNLFGQRDIPTIKLQIEMMLKNFQEVVSPKIAILKALEPIIYKATSYLPKEIRIAKTEEGYMLYSDSWKKGLTRIFKIEESFGYTLIHELKLKSILPDILGSLPNSNMKTKYIDLHRIKSIKQLADFIFIPTKESIKNDIETSLDIDNIDIKGIASDNRIEANFKRPKLNIDTLYDNKIIGEIDFSLPKKDLLAYIEAVKSDLDSKSEFIIRPLEILGEGFSSNDKKINRKTLVDSFFIYDYVKHKSKGFNEANESNEKYIAELMDIIKKSDEYYDYESKKMAMKEVKGQMSTKATVKNILHGLPDNCDIPYSTAAKHYKLFQEYIDDAGYRKLAIGGAEQN